MFLSIFLRGVGPLLAIHARRSSASFLRRGGVASFSSLGRTKGSDWAPMIQFHVDDLVIFGVCGLLAFSELLAIVFLFNWKSEANVVWMVSQVLQDS